MGQPVRSAVSDEVDVVLYSGGFSSVRLGGMILAAIGA